MRSAGGRAGEWFGVIRNLPRRNFQVELTTPRGRVFAGKASAVEFSHAEGLVQMEPGGVDYLGWIERGEISLRLGTQFRFFTLVRASASIQKRCLTVIAEVIQPTVAPVRNCANAACRCETSDAQSNAKFTAKRTADGSAARQDRRKGKA